MMMRGKWERWRGSKKKRKRVVVWMGILERMAQGKGEEEIRSEQDHSTLITGVGSKHCPFWRLDQLPSRP
jgi:hypothetical protein